MSHPKKLKLIENTWYAWQMIPGYFGMRCVPYCSPIHVTKVQPKRTGKGLLVLSFINVCYAEGVQDFEVDLKVLKRAAKYLIAEIQYGGDIDEDRCAIISQIEFEWIEHFCPSLWDHKPPPRMSSLSKDSASCYLDRIFFHPSSSNHKET